MNTIPRRNRLDLLSPAESAIVNAVSEVEEMAADERLTAAIISLNVAREHVADFVDDVPRKSPVKSGIELIAEERQRQKDVEGWTPEHDAQHTDESLASAAACYAMPSDQRRKYQSFHIGNPPRWFPRWWPSSWSVDWWKPSPDNRIRELQKAGALIAAEIDRIQAIGE